MTTMRDIFFDKLYEIAKSDSNVILLSGDIGAPSLDKYRKDLSEQYINIGIAEQNMISTAAGLSLGGKKVYVYAIASFLTSRCYEQIKLDLCSMNLDVTLLGVGAGLSYSTAGPTHHATESIAIMRTLPGMTVFCPSDNVMTRACAERSYTHRGGPVYIHLDREALPQIYDDNTRFSDGILQLRKGEDICIIATGIMVHTALTVANELANYGINTSVIDLHRIKPLNINKLVHYIRQAQKVVTIEENLIHNGIGSAVAEVIVDNDITLPLKRFAIPDKYCFKYGSREDIHKLYGLDGDSIIKNILKWGGIDT